MNNESHREQPAEEFLQEQKALYQTRLQNIINAELTPDNIKNFMDDSLNGLIQLADDASRDYASALLSKQEADKTTIEDEAFRAFGLESVSQLLDAIEEKRKILEMIDGYIARSLTPVQSVHTPPDAQEMPEREGDIGIKPREIQDRLKTVLYILLRDFHMDLTNVPLTPGTNLPHMMRAVSYVTVDIPELNRVIEVCDEVGNRTFIYNRERILELGKTLEVLRGMTKQEKRKWLRAHPGNGTSFMGGMGWRSRVSSYLSEESELVEPPVQGDKESSIHNDYDESLPLVARGEHDEWRNFGIDEKGHWGTIHAIAVRLGVEPRTFRVAVSKIGGFSIQERKWRDAMGNRIQEAYCFEEISSHPSIHELAEKAQEKKGKKQAANKDDEATQEIAGFLKDTSGRHWGSVKRIARRLGVNAGTLRRKVGTIQGLSFKKELLDARGHDMDMAYCLEELQEHPVIRDLL